MWISEASRTDTLHLEEKGSTNWLYLISRRAKTETQYKCFYIQFNAWNIFNPKQYSNTFITKKYNQSDKLFIIQCNTTSNLIPTYYISGQKIALLISKSTHNKTSMPQCTVRLVNNRENLWNILLVNHVTSYI